MARRDFRSANKLRFMQPQEFEDEAAQLLAEYGHKHGMVTTPPVPVDEIVELYLELSLEFIDMQAEFGVDDIHGALWVNEHRIGIDVRLDPTENPAMLGRYHFTLAHEAGHWRLHRQLFLRKANQPTLLPDAAQRPEYICRSSDSEPIEVQANMFASCLLMPKEMVKREWHSWRGSMDPIYLTDLRAQQQEILISEIARRGGLTLSDDGITAVLYERAIRPFAEKFAVSTQAMRYRLLDLKLLRPKKDSTLFT
ncbi:MAG: ImmA/IrrE family metallo-endopeptidase [Planctomycetaceae bacterium]|nr:ImmA/IrrE family metallo-endopeptidase [Planctomycetaceae bacterium]